MTAPYVLPEPAQDCRILFAASFACTLLAIVGAYRGWILWRSWKWSR